MCLKIWANASMTDLKGFELTESLSLICLLIQKCGNGKS